MSNRLPVLFVPHGAPTFALEPGPAGAALARTAARLPRPKAIVMVSPHWVTDAPAIGCALQLETIHDYWGFPPPLYDIRYPATGDRLVAEEVTRLLIEKGFHPCLDEHRGLDHGAWIPLRAMYPEGGIPIVPLSIQDSEGPEYHLHLGEALAPLAGQGILLIASGNITHNLRDFQTAYRSGSGTPDYVPRFAQWMWEHIAEKDLDYLVNYRQLTPDAMQAHPAEDHLLPLFVALGAAGRDYRAERLYDGIDNHVLAMDGYVFWPAS